MTPIRFLAVVVTMVAFLGGASVESVLAQSRSLFGNSGPIGQRNAGMGGMGMGGFGTTGMGGMGMGGLGAGMGGAGMGGMGMGGMGMGGMGMGGMGMGGAGLGGLGGGLGGMNAAQGGAVPYNGGFVGRSDNIGRFVGEARAGQAGMTGAGAPGMAAGATGRPGGQFGQAGGLRGGAGLANQINQPGGAFGGPGGAAGMASRQQVRPRHQIAFSYSEPTSSALASSLQGQFARLASRAPAFNGVQVDLQGEQVVLRGTVDSEHTRRLAEITARMEPGVREVVNELNVAGR